MLQTARELNRQSILKMLLVILTSVVLSQGDQKCIQVSGTCTAYEDSSGNKDAECTVKYANPYSPNIKYIGKSLYTSLTHILYIHILHCRCRPLNNDPCTVDIKCDSEDAFSGRAVVEKSRVTFNGVDYTGTTLYI